MRNVPKPVLRTAMPFPASQGAPRTPVGGLPLWLGSRNDTLARPNVNSGASLAGVLCVPLTARVDTGADPLHDEGGVRHPLARHRKACFKRAMGKRRLLAEDEPPPVRVLRDDGRSDLFLTADHAGRLIPRRLGDLGVPAEELKRHIAWDIGIRGVTERLSAALDATAVFQSYSRLVIDCNRAPGVPSSIPEISETTPIPGNVGLTEADRQVRMREIFAPYHDRIAELLDARAAVGRRTVVVAMHSFTPVFKGESRAMQIGVLFNRDVRLAHILLELLRSEGDLTVGENAPYAVSDLTDYGVPIHAERRGLPHVEIEIRQDLIADAVGQAAWAERMARVLTAADARLTAS
jgi:predicted N-formylglutamate amidohydrolase